MAILVIAGNRRQYDDWLAENFYQSGMDYYTAQKIFRYVDNPDDLRGLRDPSFIFVGSYMNRFDWPRLCDMCRTLFRTWPHVYDHLAPPPTPYLIMETSCTLEHISADDKLTEEEYGTPFD